MKKNLFAKPNLKLFLLGALVVVALKEVVMPVGSDTLPSTPMSLLHGIAPSQTEMDELRESVYQNPTAENYQILSEAHRKRGELDNAMHFLRKARLAAEIEAAAD